MRLIVARCEVEYSGRLSARLPEALRLLMIKADGAVMVHADTGGYKPLNWMTPPTAILEEDGRIVVRKVKGDDALDIRLHEVLSDVTHDMGEPEDGAAGQGRRRARPAGAAGRPAATGAARASGSCAASGRPTSGRSTSCAATTRTAGSPWRSSASRRSTRSSSCTATSSASGWIPRWAECRGVLAAQVFKPQARVLAERAGSRCVEVDLAVLRGEREPDLTLFAA